MTEKKYKQLTVFYFATTILFLISFFGGIFYMSSQYVFKVTLLFIFYITVALITLGGFVWFLVWTLSSKEGKKYWDIYIEKRGLKYSPMFNGKEPATVIRKLLLMVIGLVILVILFNNLINI